MAVENPRGYKASVRNWLRVGYGFYIVVLVLALAATGLGVFLLMSGGAGVGALRILLIGGIVVYGLLSSIFTKIEPPAGRTVTKGEAPALFGEVERIREALNVRPIQSIVVVPEYNAFASSSTALGPFGERLHIGIGMELLVSLSKEQALAVIAHELGHHAHGHVSEGASAQRVFAMWQSIVQRLARARHFAANAFLGFCKWYLPRLDAVTSASRKAHEFEADAVAARMTSQDAAAGGLIRLNVDQLDRVPRFWDEIGLLPQAQEDPVQDLFQHLQSIVADPARETVAADLASKLRVKSHVTDSHPSLSERLESLGVRVDPDDKVEVERLVALHAGPLARSAGVELLGESFQKIVQEFNAEWAANNGRQWKVRRQEFADARKKLESEETTTLLKAVAQWTVGGPTQAWPQLQEALQTNPNDPETLFMAGSCALDLGKEEGLEYLKTASQSRHWRVESLNRLCEYYANVGQHDEFDAVRDDLQKAVTDREAYDSTVNRLQKSDDITPNAVPIAEIVDIDELAKKLKHLSQVFAFTRRPTADPSIVHTGLLFSFKVVGFVADVDVFRQERAYELGALINFESSVIWYTVTDRDKSVRWLTDRRELLAWERKATQ